jgi:geranylgeranyl reductase family protein
MTADVLVIGAGPAGAAAAITLARRGIDVLLVDKAAFPRNKVCGDALIPDALAALAALGLTDEVLPDARPVNGIAAYAPGGRAVDLAGTCLVIPRRIFDDRLRQAAVRAGARFMAPYRAVAPILRGSTCAGARLRPVADDALVDVQARWTILASGAASETLRAFGVCERPQASAMAARVYLEVAPDVARAIRRLVLCFDRQLAPGYGWVFPAPGNRFNVGVGVFGETWWRNRRNNLRELMERFLESFEPARTISRAAISRTPLLGAPLRTALTGARLSASGLLVTGEAAGTTYSLTGEGIGKALETGRLAASTIADAMSSGAEATHVAAHYADAMESTFRDRFAGYQRAERYLAYPLVADLVAWRANAGHVVRAQLEGFFNETTHPRELFSVSGIVRGLLR